MAMYGFDSASHPNVSCTCKEWPEEKRAMGILLFAYGTIPDAYSICADSPAKAVALVQRLIQNSVDNLTIESGAADVRYVATKVSDAIQEGNRRVRELAEYVGHGIYIGGCVSYLIGTRYAAIPFGGGRVYTWNGTKLTIKGEDHPLPYETDAVGCTSVWKGKGRSGELSCTGSLITATDNFHDLPECEKSLIEAQTPDRHPNTNAMLLNRDLQRNGNSLCTAVIELQPYNTTPSS